MKKIFMVLGLLIPGLVFATSNNDIADRYYSSDTPTLTDKDKLALDISKKYQKGGYGSKPFMSEDGAVTFVYGSAQNTIVCSVVQTCDVALQPGEVFRDIAIGDKRVTVEPSITGSGSNEQVHVLIKPLDVGLDTSLFVATNKHAYHLRVKTSRDRYMPYVSFVYPEEAREKWERIKYIQHQEVRDNTFQDTNEYLGNLDFKYKVSGNARWKPVRVYNNGVKTIIEMPGAMRQTEAPALMVLKKKKSYFSSSENVMVNYRLIGSKFIVDNIFDSAMLVVGTGSSKQQITITRG